MTDSLDISASGLRAQRLRMTVIANNLANVDTTSTRVVREGGFEKHLPYRRQDVYVQPGMPGDPGLGVTVTGVRDDLVQEFRKKYDPNHPHAVKNPNDPDFGYVMFPNVEPIMEMVNMMAASRAYEANITAMDTAKAMNVAAMRILA